MATDDFAKLVFTGFLIAIGVLVSFAVVIPIINSLLSALKITFQIPSGLGIAAFLLWAALFVVIIVSFVLRRPAKFSDWAQFIIPALFLIIIFPLMKDIIPSQVALAIDPALTHLQLAVKEGMSVIPILNQLVVG